MSLLLKNVEIAVKLDKEIGNFFKSTIGSPQGDSASAIFFIAYLARSKKVQPNLQFDQFNRIVFLLEQQYSDDVSYCCTNKLVLDAIKRETIAGFDQRNLTVNPSKTEEYTVKPNGNENWKNCKLVGSYLDTQTDIAKRKQAANLAYCKLKNILTSKKTSEFFVLSLNQSSCTTVKFGPLRRGWNVKLTYSSGKYSDTFWVFATRPEIGSQTRIYIALLGLNRGRVLFDVEDSVSSDTCVDWMSLHLLE